MHAVSKSQSSVVFHFYASSQEGRYLASTFLSWLMASIALSVLILMGLDGIQMQGLLLQIQAYILCFSSQPRV